MTPCQAEGCFQPRQPVPWRTRAEKREYSRYFGEILEYSHKYNKKSVWDIGVAIVALYLLFLAVAAIPIASIPLHVPSGFINEGFNAYYSFAAISHGILYPPPDALIVNNYPPLSFYLVGLFGQLFGDHILAGRIIATGSLLAVAANIFLLCRWMGCDRLLATFGSGVFLATISVFATGYVAANDPQLLGHAFITSGAVMFLIATDRDQPRTALIAISAVLVVVGGLVKHNLVALPLAICTWAAIYDRRSLAKFVVSLLAIGGLALAILYDIWGQRIVAGVLYHSRFIWWPRILGMSRGTIFLLPIVLITALGFWLSTNRRKINFVIIYAVWSAAVGFPLFAGEGIDLNVLFDLVIALSMGSVGCVVVLQQRGTYFWTCTRRIIVTSIVLPVFVWAFYKQIYKGDIYESYRHLHDASAWSELEEMVSKVNGRVACNALAVCYWAGKQFELDFFNYGQKLYKNSVNDKNLLQRRFASGYYAAILLKGVQSSNNSSIWIPAPYFPETETSTLLSWYEPIRCLQSLESGYSICLLMRRTHPVKPDEATRSHIGVL
jgi:hypothetical protein